MTVLGRARRPASPDAMFLGFRLGDKRWAVATRQIARVAEVGHLHRLPGDLECNLGVVVNEGVAVGVLDLEILLGLRPSRRAPPWPRTPFACVFGRFARGIAGFPVDELLGIERQVNQESVIDLAIQEGFR